MQRFRSVIDSDRELFLILNGFHSPFWDHVMVIISNMIDWFPLYAILFYFMFRNLRKKGYMILIFLLVLISLSEGFSFLIKDLIQRLRPNQDPGLQGLVHSLEEPGLYSFVSSHAANTFAVFTFSSLVFRDRLFTCTMLFWCILVSYSRIYLGVHFPLDILGGAIVGTVAGWLVYTIMIIIEKHFLSKCPPLIAGNRLPFRQAVVIMIVFGSTLLSFLGVSFIKFCFHR